VNEQKIEEVLEFAVDIAQRAGQRTLAHYRNDELSIDHKRDGSPVTVADRGAERFLREEIEARFPNDEIRGEEEADRPGTSGRKWILDPIDGTKAFTHGVPLFANLVALHGPEGVLCGVINLPALSETVYAGRGLGCFEARGSEAPRRVHVSKRTEIDGAYLATTATDNWRASSWKAVHDAGIQVRTWGDAWGYALVATGRVDAMVDPTIEWYDIAAMPVIMAEAGGRFSDLAGRDTFEGGSGLGSNGHLHETLLGLMAR